VQHIPNATLLRLGADGDVDARTVRATYERALRGEAIRTRAGLRALTVLRSAGLLPAEPQGGQAA
jgi:hypothetical protein